MAVNKKDQIRALLKSIETGDPGPVAAINEAKYIQHNARLADGVSTHRHYFLYPARLLSMAPS